MHTTKAKCVIILTIQRLYIAVAYEKSIDELFQQYADELNPVIATTDENSLEVYEDFYEELDSWMVVSNSMNILFYGPASSFLRMDVESIMHVFQNTKKHLIPISKVLLAWNLLTDGKTAAYLQGRDFVAFGSLLNVVPEEDLYYTNFGDLSVLKYFAKFYTGLSPRKYGILAAAYVRYYGDDWNTNGSYINELGYLICGFPSVDLKKITPEAFLEINVDMFTKLDKCFNIQRQTMYNIAVHHDAYGHPYKWSSHEVTHLGHLVADIPENEIPSLHLEAITALKPEVIKLMPQRKLVFFTEKQIFRMDPKARRIIILRLQLMASLDITFMLSKNSPKLSYSTSTLSFIPVLIVATLS